ncbi:MAG: Crp/Fnr family transcriptional regulator [Allosphingosinicella sp.]
MNDKSEAGGALIRKLQIFSRLTGSEKALLAALTSDVRTVAARKNIIRDGERPEFVHLIIEGWAARYKVLRDGSRQIIAILLPGDFCDLHVTLLGQMDHGIQTLTECRIAYMRSDDVDKLTCDHNGLTRALWMATLVDESVLRSWIVNNGQREALGRIAHLLCELLYRMEILGLVDVGRFDLPLTQEEIGDAVGLTSVHTNRVLQRLRKLNLIKTGGRMLTVLDVDGLRDAAGYDPSYLHINRREPA